MKGENDNLTDPTKEGDVMMSDDSPSGKTEMFGDEVEILHSIRMSVIYQNFLLVKCPYHMSAAKCAIHVLAEGDTAH